MNMVRQVPSSAEPDPVAVKRKAMIVLDVTAGATKLVVRPVVDERFAAGPDTWVKLVLAIVLISRLLKR